MRLLVLAVAFAFGVSGLSAQANGRAIGLKAPAINVINIETGDTATVPFPITGEYTPTRALVFVNFYKQNAQTKQMELVQVGEATRTKGEWSFNVTTADHWDWIECVVSDTIQGDSSFDLFNITFKQ